MTRSLAAANAAASWLPSISSSGSTMGTKPAACAAGMRGARSTAMEHGREGGALENHHNTHKQWERA